jgi:hypothetical protein
MLTYAEVLDLTIDTAIACDGVTYFDNGSGGLRTDVNRAAREAYQAQKNSA